MIKKVTPQLKIVLKRKGMTQYDLAMLTNLQQGTISRFDSSTRHDDFNLFLIADALNVNVEELFKIERNDKN